MFSTTGRCGGRGRSCVQERPCHRRSGRIVFTMVAVLHPVADGNQIVIDRAVVLVGRSPDCDAIMTQSSKISRLHCALVQVDEGYFIRDLGSMNGCWVNGSRVKTEAQINGGDRIGIGDVEFRFAVNEQMPAGVAVTPQTHIPVVIDDAPRRRPIVEDDVVEVVEIVDDETHDPHQQTVSASADDDEIEVLEDVEVIEDGIDILDRGIEIVDEDGEADVIEDVEVIEEPEDADLVEDVEVIEDVDIRTDRPPDRRAARRARRRRLR